MNNKYSIFRITLSIIFGGVIFFLPYCSSAQQNDSLTVKRSVSDSLLYSHSPMKASIMSAVVPGLGQIYNTKKGKPNYLKVPIIYAALGAGIYMIGYNYNNYQEAKQFYLDREDGVESASSPYYDYSNAQLIDEIEANRRYMELSIIGTIAVYVLNIVDASVYAHLYHFDVSDDLAINFRPNIYPSLASNHTFVGGTLQFQF